MLKMDIFLHKLQKNGNLLKKFQRFSIFQKFVNIIHSFLFLSLFFFFFQMKKQTVAVIGFLAISHGFPILSQPELVTEDFISETDFDIDVISKQDYARLFLGNGSRESDTGNVQATGFGYLRDTKQTDMLSPKDITDSTIAMYRSLPNSLYNIFCQTYGASDTVCSTYSSAFMPYTGFRFITTSHLHFGAYTTHKTSTLVYCYQGKEVTRTSKNVPHSKRDILWGSHYCFSKEQSLAGLTKGGPLLDGCYVPARMARAKYTETAMAVSWRRPERVYGGLFKVPQTGIANDIAVPVAPLLADEPYMGYIQRGDSQKGASVSLPHAYTPDYYAERYPWATDSWAKYIDVKEDYKPILPERLPLDTKGYVQWVAILRWVFMNDIILSQVKNIYQEMPWRPEIFAAAVMGTVPEKELRAARVPTDIRARLGLEKLVPQVRQYHRSTDPLGPVLSTPHNVIAAGIPTIPGIPGSPFMPIHKTPYKQPKWLAQLRKKTVHAGLSAGGVAYRTTMNQVKTRLVMVKDKRFAKFLYLVVSYMVNP